MILITKVRRWMSPEQRERELVPWGPNATAERLAPEWVYGEDGVCWRNGAEFPRELWSAVLADGDNVVFTTVPGIPAAIGIPLAKFLILVGASWALSQMLLPSLRPAKKSDEGFYGFTGLEENSRALGQPFQVVYGNTRISGRILNRYVRISLDENGIPRTELLLLIHISEGPIKSIGKKTADGGPFSVARGDLEFMKLLEVNGQPASNYEGIEAWVRLGDPDQEPIDEFAQPVKQLKVDADLLGPSVLTAIADQGIVVPTTTNAIATAGTHPPTSDVDVEKWNTEPSLVGFTMPDSADEFVVVVNFPSGLSDFSTAPTTNFARFQIRYREVDGFGTPIGDYIILPEEPIVGLNRQAQFEVEFRHKLFTPGSYIPPILGFYLQNGTVNNGATYVIDPLKYPAPTPATAELSFVGWIKGPIAKTDPDARIFDWCNSAAFKGIRFTFKGGAAFSTFQLNYGDGTALSANIVGTLTVAPTVGVWHQVAFSYKANADGTRHRFRIFFDGSLKLEKFVTGSPMVMDPAQTMRLGRNNDGTAIPFNGSMDDAYVFNRELSPYDITQFYNFGSPLSIDAENENLIVGFRMNNELVFSGRRYSDAIGFAKRVGGLAATGDGLDLGVSPRNANDPQCSVIAGASNLGVVRSPESGTVKRARYRIEVLRLNVEDSATNALKPDKAQWLWTQTRRFQPYAYGGEALLAVKIPTSQQFESSGDVTVTQVVEGKLISVWDGVDPVSPNLPVEYSRNPAWVVVDMATNKLYGGGAFYDIFTQIDLPGFDAFAAICDTYIYDNGPTASLVTVREFASGAHNIPFDHVEWEVLSPLPTNFPGVTATDLDYPLGLRLTSDVPGSSPPAWFTAHRNVGASEIVQIEYVQASGHFFIRCRHNAAFSSGASFAPAGVRCQLYDVRFRFDGVFDERDAKLWDSIIQVMQTARAVPLRLGRRLSVIFDDVAQPVALVGMGNIVPGSFEFQYVDTRGRPNRMTAEFRDQDANWRTLPAELEHPSVNDPAGTVSFIDKEIQLRGVTRRGQVMRHMMRELNSHFLLTQAFKWQQGLDALTYLPGQVVALAHDVAGLGISGRLYADSASNTTVKLDREVVIESGKTYQVHVMDAVSETRQVRTITSGPATYGIGATLTVSSAFSFLPSKDDVYAFGEVTAGDSKLVRFMRCRRIPDQRRVDVEAITYDAQVYDDNFGELPDVQTTFPEPSAIVVPPGVENLVVTEITTKGPDGAMRITAEVAFSHWRDSYPSVARTQIYVSDGDHLAGIGRGTFVATLDPKTTTFRIEGFHFERGRTYTVWVHAEGVDGSSPHKRLFSWSEFSPSGLAPVPSAPKNIRVAMTGEHAVYEWDDADDGSLDMGAVVEGRRGGGWILGIPVFSVPAQGRASHPIVDWAASPDNVYGVGTPDLVVRLKLRNGQTSVAVALEHEPIVGDSYGDSLSEAVEDGHWTT